MTAYGGEQGPTGPIGRTGPRSAPRFQVPWGPIIVITAFGAIIVGIAFLGLGMKRNQTDLRACYLNQTVVVGGSQGTCIQVDYDRTGWYAVVLIPSTPPVTVTANLACVKLAAENKP
jgi:hypothetical protein